MQTSTAYKEVELKVKIFQNAFVELKKLLAQIAIPKDVITQEDFYLDNPSNSFFLSDQIKDNQKSLRIRSSQQANSLCLKVAHRSKNENDFYRDEYEVQIDSPEKALRLFSHLGYSVIKTFKKERSVFTYLDYEITLDEISGIAPETVYMCEIEIKTPCPDHVAVINTMETFLKTTLRVTDYEKCMHGVEKYVTKNKAN